MNLYHFVPKNLKGQILYPLNKLESKFKDVHTEHDAKYDGREEIKKEVIPGLGKWNDAIHLSPIDPEEVILELRKAGIEVDWEWKVFIINADTLDWTKMKIMYKTEDDGKLTEHFVDFNENTYNQHKHLPEHTLRHYREAASRGELPFNFGGAPHVFYKGSINIQNAPVKTYN